MHNSGRCNCGSVKFETDGAPVRMAQCHCDACRRATGAGFSAQAFFNRDQVVISGPLSEYDWVADSGSARKFLFCPRCGSRLFSENGKHPERIGIAAGAFDDSSWFRPEVRVHAGQKPVWVFVDPDIPVGS